MRRLERWADAPTRRMSRRRLSRIAVSPEQDANRPARYTVGEAKDDGSTVVRALLWVE